jgi:uncharacterized protein YjiK
LKRDIDWGTWLSMAAVAVVCVVIALRLANGPSDLLAVADAPGEPVFAKEKDKDKGDKKDDDGDKKKDDDKKKDEGESPRAALGPGYRLNNPDSTVVLPKTLNEVSGLSASSEAGTLWAVHDERGTLFRISIADGKVLKEIELGKRGDYEGVEEAEGLVYVGRSEGVLLVVDPAAKGDAKPKQLNFQKQLGLACDLEGVGYESRKKRLLLTCKNESMKSRQSNKAFEIYAMSVETQTVGKDPAYVLSENAIDDYIAAHPELDDLKKSKGKDFAPSGIAVHPDTAEIYILSTRGKMMLVLDPKGELVRAYGLDQSVHLQPEGITFTPDGTLYVSNEAHGKSAQLLGFKFKSAEKTAAKN